MRPCLRPESGMVRPHNREIDLEHDLSWADRSAAGSAVHDVARNFFARFVAASASAGGPSVTGSAAILLRVSVAMPTQPAIAGAFRRSDLEGSGSVTARQYAAQREPLHQLFRQRVIPKSQS
jgi:hypothetical protein